MTAFDAQELVIETGNAQHREGMKDSSSPGQVRISGMILLGVVEKGEGLRPIRHIEKYSRIGDGFRACSRYGDLLLPQTGRLREPLGIAEPAARPQLRERLVKDLQKRLVLDQPQNLFPAVGAHFLQGNRCGIGQRPQEGLSIGNVGGVIGQPFFETVDFGRSLRDGCNRG